MNKPFEVQEFDSIVGNKEFEHNSKYKYMDEEAFADLNKFVREFTANEDNADVLDFMKVGLKRNVGDVITIKNYVGLIQMKNGFQVQILPKIYFDETDEGNKRTKTIFLNMLKSMKDFPGKAFNTASLKVDRMNLYELFINMYLQEVRKLVKHGLKSAYVVVEDNLNFYKGKLMVNQHIKANLAHKERFYMAHDEFLLDRPENRIVKSTLLKLQGLTGSAENSKEIRQALLAFELVEPSKNYDADFAKITIDRNTKDYESLMPWSKVFLMNKSFSTFSGETTSRALLFPMESVYESYVALKMKKVFGSDGWHVSSQDKGKHLFEEPNKKFKLRPDIVIKKDKRIIILDTKWKKLIPDPRVNYGISQADMYQMYAYSKKYNTSEIWLLYPLNADMKGKDNIYYLANDEESIVTRVNVFFVDVANIESSLLELRNRIG
ncbi:restriction endonuclease [Butyrivibrio sp. CB08]|uniref:McrC family protein n=1 Tax=Butyrivibrio sp. CB08 TaxID=2364879 RepID=UPI000EA8CF5E|nr:McrC family protein [Butyrivibrio sp. CB08]RKM56818.1 restriction endonuclease [Butyrivibrio sp. CB08]